MRILKIGAPAAVIAWAAVMLLAAPVAAQESPDAFISATGIKEGVVDPDEQDAYPAPGAPNSVHVVPGAAFAGDGWEAADSYVFWFFNGAIEGTGLGVGCVRAPVHIPDDGVAYQFWASVIDNDPSGDHSVYLWRKGTYSGIAEVMATATATSDSASIQSVSDLTISQPDLIYPDYSYYLTSCLYDDTRKVYSGRIWYHPEGIFEDGFGTGNTNRWSTRVP
jgi:hypothetical protein